MVSRVTLQIQTQSSSRDTRAVDEAAHPVVVEGKDGKAALVVGEAVEAHVAGMKQTRGPAGGGRPTFEGRIPVSLVSPR